MAIFTAIAGAIVASIGLTGLAASIATSLIAGGLALGVSRLIAPRGSSGTSQQEDAVSGGRIQLPPATNNKLPLVYGTAFIGGSIIDAKISSDLQSMWYVIAMAEVTNTMPGDTPDTITFNEIYYDNKLATLSGAQVTSLTSNTAGTPEVDNKINGNLFIYLFPNGSSSGTNTGGQSAIQIMSDPEIPSDQRWNQGIYTASGQAASMTNTAFVIVKVKYNQDAGTTSLGVVTAKITNSRTKPGDCIKDYLLNSRYGCAVPAASINNASLTALNDYSDKPIIYTPMGGGSPTTQVRYRINGPLDTTKSCLSNLQDMVDACDSWMQYSELTGQWKVVINKAYDETPDAISFSNLYSVTNNNLTSGINVNPTDLNQTYNQVEYQYPNTNIKDQLDYIFISLQDDIPGLLSANEPINKLTIKNDLVNNYVQAKFIAIRRLLQGREDLIVTLQTDYSGIQVEAGDVIRITNEVYGWTDKLFRVSNVVEEKDAEGNLFARLTAFEYNSTIYDDDLDITDFVPADNTGLQDPNIIAIPNPPTVSLDVEHTLNTMNITGVVPTGGLTRYLDFNYGTSSNTANHEYYTTSTNSNGAPLIANTSYSIAVNELSAGNLYWSVTARNDTVGVRSNASSVVVWPGANITTPNTISVCNASSSGTLVTSDVITGNIVGGTIAIISGSGTLAPNTIIANVVSNTQFNLSVVPTVALGNACVDITTGGINGNIIQPGTITANSLANGASKLTVQDEGYTVVTTSVINFIGDQVFVADGGGDALIFIGSQPVGNVDFKVANLNANTVNVPVDVTSTANRNIPVFIPGTDPGANYYYPYLQGTSTTANYYLANSTSAFQPLNASVLRVDDGDDNWYRILEANTSYPVPLSQRLLFDYNLQLVSDADNTVVQIGYGVRPEGETHNLIYTPSMTTINLDANLPVLHSAVKNKQFVAVGNSDAGGVWIRNLSNGSNVSTITGELFLSTDFFYVPPPVVPPARYWRVLVGLTGGSEVSCAELQMRIVSGGTNVATGGIASASSVYSPSYPASNAFDGDPNTIWASSTISGTWIEYDFGAGNEKDIVEITWRGRNDGYANQNPSDFAIQYSTDSVVWVDAWRVHGTPYTTPGEVRTFTKPTGLGSCQYWAVRMGRGTGAAVMGGSEMDLAESNGGSDITGSRTGARAYSTFAGFPVTNLFDNDINTAWSSGGTSADIEDFVYVALEWATPKLIEEVKWRARENTGLNQQLQSPTRGWVERSSDNINFETYWTFTTPATWTSQEERTFQRVP